jgi:6-phosphogluconolactonase (cycloisomerase 2 family)
MQPNFGRGFFQARGVRFQNEFSSGSEVFSRRRKMRMKFNKSGQLVLVSAASLLVAALITACGTLTVDFVFVTSSKAAGSNNYGEVDVFEVNSESGFMRQIPTSPFPSGGRNPVAEAISSDNTNLYVVNQDDNTIVQFIIGNDGKLYPQNTVNTPGIFPFAAAVNGTNLFVADTYQPLPSCSTAAPCSGSIAVFPITASSATPPSDALGSPLANGSLNYWPLSLPASPQDLLEPTGIDVLASGKYLYVTAYDSTVRASYIFGFSITGGALAPLNGGVPLGGSGTPFATGTCSNAYLNAPFVAGTCPSAIASDSTGSYVYAADPANSSIHGYSVNAATGLLTALSGSPFPAGDQPSAIVIDPAYSYLYVANAQDSTVMAYSMSNGALTRLGSYPTGLQPVAIGVDPSTNHFLYTANFLGTTVNGTVSGFELSPTAGTLVNSQNSPYTANSLPTAIVGISHKTAGSSAQK